MKDSLGFFRHKEPESKKRNQTVHRVGLTENHCHFRALRGPAPKTKSIEKLEAEPAGKVRRRDRFGPAGKNFSLLPLGFLKREFASPASRLTGGEVSAFS
jgi:hypothetical protein